MDLTISQKCETDNVSILSADDAAYTEFPYLVLRELKPGKFRCPRPVWPLNCHVHDSILIGRPPDRSKQYTNYLNVDVGYQHDLIVAAISILVEEDERDDVEDPREDEVGGCYAEE